MSRGGFLYTRFDISSLTSFSSSRFEPDLFPPAKDLEELEDEAVEDSWDEDGESEDEDIRWDAEEKDDGEEEEAGLNVEKEDGSASDASDEEVQSRSRSVSGTPVLGSSALGSDTEEEEEKRDEKHEQRESDVEEGEDGFEVSRVSLLLFPPPSR